MDTKITRGNGLPIPACATKPWRSGACTVVNAQRSTTGVDNSHPKIIGLDLDGVIIDHSEQKLRLAAEFGISLSPEQTHSDIFKRLIPRDVLRQIEQLLYNHPEAHKLSPLMEGAKDGLEKIKNIAPYFLISRRKIKEAAADALRFHGLWPDFFNEKNAFFVIHPEEKNIKARELGITHYIDDQQTILEYLSAVPNKFLFDKFDIFPDTASIRVKSWNELIDKLKNPD